MFPFGETITIVRLAPPTFPTMGDAPAVATSTDIDNCAVWPTQTTELIVGQDTVTWDLDLVVPFGTDVRSDDQVEYEGVTYDIVGRPQPWRSPFTGSTPGTVINLKSSTG